MSKRSVALAGVLIFMVMIGGAFIGAMSAPASASEVIETTYLFLPLVMREAIECEPPDLESAISAGIGAFDLSTVEFVDQTIDAVVGVYEMTFASATYGSLTHELLDLNDGNYQLNVSVEDISITYDITCVSGLCLPVPHAWIDIERIDYQGDFRLGATPECSYFLETYSGETTLSGIDVYTNNSVIDVVIPLYIDAITDGILDEFTYFADNFFIAIIEGAL